MVRTVKDLLFKGPDPYLALLLLYRDTPGPNGISPSQAPDGKLQTRLPKLVEQLVPSLPCHTSVTYSWGAGGLRTGVTLEGGEI